MVKLFGFMLAVAMVSSANAALLVSYQYTDPDSKDATFVESGINADSSSGVFSVNNGLQRISSSVSNTTAVRTETFSFATSAPNSISLNSMTFNSALISGSRSVSFTPSFKVNGVTVASNLYSVSGTGFGAYTVNFTNPLVIGTSNFEAFISAQGTSGGASGNSTSFSLDDIRFDGQIVPEPASMAIFGLLGVGAAARHYRRKK